MTQKRQCHARESGHPDLAARAGALDSRFHANDTTLKDLIMKRIRATANWRTSASKQARTQANRSLCVARRDYWGERSRKEREIK
jgi:hypothetical protein